LGKKKKHIAADEASQAQPELHRKEMSGRYIEVFLGSEGGKDKGGSYGKGGGYSRVSPSAGRRNFY